MSLGSQWSLCSRTCAPRSRNDGAHCNNSAVIQSTFNIQRSMTVPTFVIYGNLGVIMVLVAVQRSPALYRGTCRRSSHFSESCGILFYWKFVYRFCLLYSPTPTGLSHPQGQRVQNFPLAQSATEWSVSRGLRYLEFENMSSVRQRRNATVHPFNKDKTTL